jgi:hypothetical protein
MFVTDNQFPWMFRSSINDAHTAAKHRLVHRTPLSDIAQRNLQSRT